MFRLLASENGFIHVCGHRGHSIGSPENTLAAFKLALDMGARYIELDVHQSKDGHIVVCHDDNWRESR